MTTRNRTKRAFTIVEILVVTAILALLTALLLPVFFHARHAARLTACLSNLHQLGLATQLYESDFDSHLPAEDPETNIIGRGKTTHTRNSLSKYGMTADRFRCPEAGKFYAAATDYEVRFVLMPVFVHPTYASGFDILRMEPEPGTVLAFCKWHLQDAQNINYGQNPNGSLFWRNTGFFNVLRADGSVAKVNSSLVQPKNWEWGEYTGKYQNLNEYQLFPGEPWPPQLTHVDMIPD